MIHLLGRIENWVQYGPESNDLHRLARQLRREAGITTPMAP